MITTNINEARNGLRYSDEEKAFLDNLSKVLEDRAEMERVAPYIAASMQRSISGIQNQIEERKGWFFK